MGASPVPEGRKGVLRSLIVILVCFALLAGNAAASEKVPHFWKRVAHCETGGKWNWGQFAHSNHRRQLEGTSYEGGLGFYVGTWRTWARAVHVLTRYPHAYMAPPVIQVKVARYGLARGGYWGSIHNGCARA
ncbi:MAG: hypothetical protein F2663_04810 [Actinobacteria bacterium]|uniref:Unannotated protein n=1 Tax=freshwater metagenome TaxID=449393 RepID=A0A6J6PEH5_9ZZZZ|nr:hypothetical protein [Actinomycetota bacterium]